MLNILKISYEYFSRKFPENFPHNIFPEKTTSLINYISAYCGFAATVVFLVTIQMLKLHTVRLFSHDQNHSKIHGDREYATILQL